MKAAKKSPEKMTPVAVRLPKSFLDRLDKVAQARSLPGMRMNRTDILRLAAFQGLDEIERTSRGRGR